MVIWRACADLWTRVEQASQRNIERPWLQFKRGWTKIMLVEIPSHDKMGRITASNLQNSRAFPGLTTQKLSLQSRALCSSNKLIFIVIAEPWWPNCGISCCGWDSSVLGGFWSIWQWRFCFTSWWSFVSKGVSHKMMRNGRLVLSQALSFLFSLIIHLGECTVNTLVTVYKSYGCKKY